MKKGDEMGENYPTLHDLVRFGQKRESDQLRLVNTERAWESAVIVCICLGLAAALVVGLVLCR